MRAIYLPTYNPTCCVGCRTIRFSSCLSGQENLGKPDKRLSDFKEISRNIWRFKHFGLKVHMALKKSLWDHELEEFTKNATNVYQRALAYIEKWYPFENHNYKTFCCLDFECGRLLNYSQYLHGSSNLPLKIFAKNWLHFKVFFLHVKVTLYIINMWCNFSKMEHRICWKLCSLSVVVLYPTLLWNKYLASWEMYGLTKKIANTRKRELCVLFNIMLVALNSKMPSHAINLC